MTQVSNEFTWYVGGTITPKDDGRMLTSLCFRDGAFELFKLDANRTLIKRFEGIKYQRDNQHAKNSNQSNSVTWFSHWQEGKGGSTAIYTWNPIVAQTILDFYNSCPRDS